MRGTFRQRLEAMTSLVHELAVVKPLTDQHVHHRQRDGGIGADPRTHPDVCKLRSCRALGVDHDHAGAALLRGFQFRPLDRIGDLRIAADDQGAACIVDIFPSDNRQACDLSRDGATAAAQVLIDHPVRRANRAQHEGCDDRSAECSATRGADDGFRSIGAADFGEAIGNFVESLVPGDARPLAFTPRANAAVWVQQPVGIVGQARRPPNTLDAECTCGMWAGGIGRVVDDLAVFDGGERATVGRAFPAGGRIDAVCNGLGGLS